MRIVECDQHHRSTAACRAWLSSARSEHDIQPKQLSFVQATGLSWLFGTIFIDARFARYGSNRSHRFWVGSHEAFWNAVLAMLFTLCHELHELFQEDDLEISFSGEDEEDKCALHVRHAVLHSQPLVWCLGKAGKA